MSLIKNTWEIVNQFTTSPSHVFIVERNIGLLADSILKYKNKNKRFPYGKPEWMYGLESLQGHPLYYEPYMIIAYELILDSVNYNYWIGRGDVRANGSSASDAARLLNESFSQAICICSGNYKSVCSMAINIFEFKLVNSRYPNLSNRIKHLKEVQETFRNTEDWWIGKLITDINQKQEIASVVLEAITTQYPGYASDIFLKRAFLFIIEMNRRMGWFQEDIASIPVPTDYHLPNVLRHFNIIEYEKNLSDKIARHELIHEGSLEECEIRASTMIACQMIASQAGVTMADVDSFLFSNRRLCKDPFHLTITTNY